MDGSSTFHPEIRYLAYLPLDWATFPHRTSSPTISDQRASPTDHLSLTSLPHHFSTSEHYTGCRSHSVLSTRLPWWPSTASTAAARPTSKTFAGLCWRSSVDRAYDQLVVATSLCLEQWESGTGRAVSGAVHPRSGTVCHSICAPGTSAVGSSPVVWRQHYSTVPTRQRRFRELPFRRRRISRHLLLLLPWFSTARASPYHLAVLLVKFLMSSHIVYR